MRVLHDEHVIELTERNLRALLAKLSGHPPDSACTIAKHGWGVRAVPDDEHYSDIPAGEMHPTTTQHMDSI